MKEVLSTRAIELHKEYLRAERLKLSIFEKSYPGVKEIEDRYLLRFGLTRGEREELVRLRARIFAHELFFSSFCDNRFTSSGNAREQYGDETHLLNLVYRVCMDSFGGIVFILIRGREICVERYIEGERPTGAPILAIDNCEHVYFLDYGFDKGTFLTRLLPYLALSKIDEFYKIG